MQTLFSLWNSSHLWEQRQKRLVWFKSVIFFQDKGNGGGGSGDVVHSLLGSRHWLIPDPTQCESSNLQHMLKVFPFNTHFKNTIGLHVYSEIQHNRTHRVLHMFWMFPQTPEAEKGLLFSHSPNEHLSNDFYRPGIMLAMEEQDTAPVVKKLRLA